MNRFERFRTRSEKRKNQRRDQAKAAGALGGCTRKTRREFSQTLGKMRPSREDKLTKHSGEGNLR